MGRTAKSPREIELKGLKVLVVGLGKSGLAASRFLYSRGAAVTATDRRDGAALPAGVEDLKPLATLRLGEHRQEDFDNADLIVLSPGVAASLPQLDGPRRNKVPVWSEVELGYRFLEGTYLAVTGSNGKTTTVSLLGDILKSLNREVFIVGNIGQPLTGIIGKTSVDPILVIELSSFQLETIDSFRPHVAALLNVTPDHLDRHSTLEAYIASKRLIFMNQQPSDVAILNEDDPVAAASAENCLSKPLLFSRRRRLEEGAFVDRDRLVVRLAGVESEIVALGQIAVPGAHNLENVLAASLAARILEVSPSAIASAVARFRGVEHRLEHVVRIDGVDYYNDSKATNPESAIRAVEAFKQPLILVLGGLDKGSDFTELCDVVAGRVSRAILLGSTADKLDRLLRGRIATRRAASLAEAVTQAHQHARRGDVVLFSPACASFDMFENFEQRGREFKRIVSSLKGSRQSEAR